MSSRERSLSRAPFPDILLRSGSNNFKLGWQPSQSEKSQRGPDEQMVSQNNYTLKHNSLTESYSWRGARWLLAYGKYEWPPHNSSKPKGNEEWRFENSHCGGRAVSTTPSDKVCPSSRFLWTTSEKMKPCNSNPEIANSGAPSTRSTPPPSMFAPVPASSSAMIFINKLFQNSTRILLAHLHNNFLFKGTWRLMKMAKWVLAEPTTDSVSASDKMSSSCRITLFSDIPWNSKIWQSIGGFTCLNP